MNLPKKSLEQIFETHVQTLSLTLQFRTVRNYRSVFQGFLEPRGGHPKPASRGHLKTGQL